MIQRNKEKSSFTEFDILDFYPSIAKDRLTNVIKDKKVIDTIMHSTKSLLFSNNEIWVKKDNTLLWEASTEQRYPS